MPALCFPNLDALRVVIASGLVPPAMTQVPVLAGSDQTDGVWLDVAELPPRESLAALARFGVQVHGNSPVPTQSARCWAEILPLRRTDHTSSGVTLFEVPDRRLAALVARLQRQPHPSTAVRLLATVRPGRSWVTAACPPALVAWLENPDAEIRAYREQAAHVWVARGWEHPLAGHLVVPGGGVLLCDPVHGVTGFPEPVPEPREPELALSPRKVPPSPARPSPTIDIHFRLQPGAEPRDAAFWVLSSPDREFETFCREANERLLRRFQIATVNVADRELLLVRRTKPNDHTAHLAVSARGFHTDPRAPWLFLPTGTSLRPAIRLYVLARELGYAAGQIVWVEEAEAGIAVHTIAESAFHPLCDQLRHVAPARAVLAPARPAEELFGFARFALQVETSIELEPEQLVPDVPREVSSQRTESQPGWMSRSVARMMRWVARQRHTATQPTLEERPSAPREPRRMPAIAEPEPEHMERKLHSADALLHGHDWAKRRHELETRLLADFTQLDADARATRWAELASIYTATGQAHDAAVCWANAIWDSESPPEAWREQWAAAECRAAKRSERVYDLDRWLGEPARLGTGRVIAALAVLFGSRSVPPPEFIAALPRVLAVLEQQFEDIPVRAAWLARLAVAHCCDGDALGVARWRDRLIRRLHDRGPALDLDEPSFLRFRGRATAERFKVAREWLARTFKAIRGWAAEPTGIGGLELVGLASETKATPEYAQLMLAWGLGVLGERTRSREWAAQARKALGGVRGAGVDPAGHAFLADYYLYRIKEAHEGAPAKPGLPPELQERYEQLPKTARYCADRLREHSRILQPVGAVRAYGGLDCKEFWGTDRLGDRLALLASRTDAAQINDEARDLLAIAGTEPTTATVPRIALALLDCAAWLDVSLLEPLLELVPTALDWVEAWVQAGGWKPAERADRVARYRARMLEAAFAVAPAPAAERLLRSLVRGTSSSGMQQPLLVAAPRIFRAAHRFELTSAAEALAEVLDPARSESLEQLLPAERVGLAAGWFVAGDEEAGNRILNAARESLFHAAPTDPPARTALALAYAEALGFAPVGIALGRLEEIFQRLNRRTIHCSGNSYFTLQPLRLIDTVVRSVVTEDFTLSPSVRAWLDEDEFLIRRRIHREMALVVRDCEQE